MLVDINDETAFIWFHSFMWYLAMHTEKQQFNFQDFSGYANWTFILE